MENLYDILTNEQLHTINVAVKNTINAVLTGKEDTFNYGPAKEIISGELSISTDMPFAQLVNMDKGLKHVAYSVASGMTDRFIDGLDEDGKLVVIISMFNRCMVLDGYKACKLGMFDRDTDNIYDAMNLFRHDKEIDMAYNLVISGITRLDDIYKTIFESKNFIVDRMTEICGTLSAADISEIAGGKIECLYMKMVDNDMLVTRGIVYAILLAFKKNPVLSLPEMEDSIAHYGDYVLVKTLNNSVPQYASMVEASIRELISETGLEDMKRACYDIDVPEFSEEGHRIYYHYDVSVKLSALIMCKACIDSDSVYDVFTIIDVILKNIINSLNTATEWVS